MIIVRNLTVMEAYGRLGVKPEAVALAPQITPELRAIARTIRRAGQPKKTRKRLKPDGRGAGDLTIAEDTRHSAPHGPGADLSVSWIKYLQASDDPDAQKISQSYHSIPKFMRPHLPIEAYCIAAAVSPMRVLEILTAIVVRMGAQASTIIAAVNHPRVVQKTVEMALTDNGVEDRNTLHKATGFLPTPKGAQTTIQVVQNAQANASARAESASAAAPSAESTIRRLADRFNESRSLASAPVATLPAASEADAIDIRPAREHAERVSVPVSATAPAAFDDEDSDDAGEDA